MLVHRQATGGAIGRSFHTLTAAPRRRLHQGVRARAGGRLPIGARRAAPRRRGALVAAGRARSDSGGGRAGGRGRAVASRARARLASPHWHGGRSAGAQPAGARSARERRRHPTGRTRWQRARMATRRGDADSRIEGSVEHHARPCVQSSATIGPATFGPVRASCSTLISGPIPRSERTSGSRVP